LRSFPVIAVAAPTVSSAASQAPAATAGRWSAFSIFIDTLKPQVFSPHLVWELGHSRWKQENGWKDLSQNWALNHGFLHACKHRPKQRSANDPAQLVPNRGLAAVTLILLLAFTLCSAFCLLHSKLVRFYHISFLEVARQLHRSLWQQPSARTLMCSVPLFRNRSFQFFFSPVRRAPARVPRWSLLPTDCSGRARETPPESAQDHLEWFNAVSTQP
jgi:hypothetical protein